jgi:hypothetical protein
MTSTGDPVGAAPDEVPRAFTDASVLMAAALSETGTAYELFEAARRGVIALVASVYAPGETERSLYRKAPRGLRFGSCVIDWRSSIPRQS